MGNVDEGHLYVVPDPLCFQQLVVVNCMRLVEPDCRLLGILGQVVEGVRVLRIEELPDILIGRQPHLGQPVVGARGDHVAGWGSRMTIPARGPVALFAGREVLSTPAAGAWRLPPEPDLASLSANIFFWSEMVNLFTMSSWSAGSRDAEGDKGISARRTNLSTDR